MCGIYGVVADNASNVSAYKLSIVARNMFKTSEIRGKDASGALTVLPEQIKVLKSPEKASHLIKQHEFRELLASASSAYKEGAPFIIAGHSRMVTKGSANNNSNNQPVIKGKHLVLHNGIIVNEVDLWHSNTIFKKEYQVDSEIVCDLLALEACNNKTVSESFRLLFQKIKGCNTIAALSLDKNQIVIGTSNGSMYYWQSKKEGIVIYASERFIVERAKKIMRLTSGAGEIEQLGPCCAMRIDLNNAGLVNFSLVDKLPVLDDIDAIKHRKLSLSVIDLHMKERTPSFGNKLLSIERNMRLDLLSIKNIKRCSKCLLPSTFPFISFDENGVCQMCRQYDSIQLKGVGKLYSLADKIRKSDGRPDCLVPISGGRDSCYGLHFVKKELGLNPVAYTYDWGLVTDLARRNISRMCGSLGVEHVLVAANIRKKRDNVRKNISAWLKSPNLGMIPLFMAGDKMFFYYASMIRKQMNLSSILFSMNWLERTGFKHGFAGVNELGGPSSNVSEKTHSMELSGKIQLLSFYIKQFITNRKYLNGSLSDTMFAFISFYLKNKDYDSIFDYLQWDEALIERTIIDNYDWETSKDTTSTWRIGDGTAPFYNYIYLSVAGFSEHDTFRSNQVREGLISREKALSLIEEENQPRAESFKWYCDTVGIDALEALKVINNMPKLY